MLMQTEKALTSGNSTSPDTPVLALNGVTKTFPGVTALSEVSLQLYPGKVTALIGENLNSCMDHTA